MRGNFSIHIGIGTRIGIGFRIRIGIRIGIRMLKQLELSWTFAGSSG